jgi:predicted MFS family arabinose efflux permease
MILTRRDTVIVFLAFAFAYFFSALVRAITATLAPALTQEFSLDASALGLLAGGYFLGFAATQLPLGAWLDRYGPRTVVLGFLSVAVAGCVAFSLATGFSSLLAARILCGAGLGACLMAPLTGFRRWLEPPAQLRANSWMLMTGSFGMLSSTLPVQWLIPLAGWRPIFWGLAALLSLSMLLIAWKVPAWTPVPAAGPPVSYKEVWRNRFFRRLAPVGFVSYGGMIAMQTLWAGPWMVRVAGYDPLASAAGLFTINLTMLLAFWTWGLVTPHLARRGILPERMITWGMPLSFVAMAGLLVAGPAAGAGAWALFCLSSTFMSLAQPAVGMALPQAIAGRALSAYNLVIFAGVFMMQWGIGLLIDGLLALGWSELASFRGALTVFLVLSIASWLYLLLGPRDNPVQ